MKNFSEMSTYLGTGCPVLTCKHLFANHLINRTKPVENRSWSVKPGWIILHAGVGQPGSIDEELLAAVYKHYEILTPFSSVLPGHVVGAIFVHSVMECTNDIRLQYAPHAVGPLCWIIGDVIKLTTPLPASGKLGLWKL